MTRIWQQAKILRTELMTVRRDLHQYPETGWTEFRTASVIINSLRALGYEVHFGPEVVDESSMMEVPASDELEDCARRAIKEGAEPELVKEMIEGKTGIVAIYRTNKPGKTVAFRFDMDANDVEEARSATHRPYKEGFASKHKNIMHACGHDGHVAIGLGVAKLFMENRNLLVGTVKLIFQPSEEGVRGALAMTKAGIVDDVNYFFSGHIGFKAMKNNTIVTMTGGFLATTKLDVEFKGVSAHAGATPEQGRNALLAAAQAAVSLNTISRHSKGLSRINVGVLNAGTGRNVVADTAVMKMETRGSTTEVNEFMVGETKRMLQACADLYGVGVKIELTGSAPACATDLGLAREVAQILKRKCDYAEIREYADLGASEDCTYFMKRVQEKGGRAIYLMYGSAISAGHHSSYFDFNEECLWQTVAALTEIGIYFTNK